MSKYFLSFVIAVLILFIPIAETTYSWGFFAHKKINRMAIFTLPEGMVGFYKKHIEHITEHAVDPDRRRYANADEGARHYIDIDHYSWDSIPKNWKKAKEKFTEDTLKKHGIVPWHIDVMVQRLTKAFKDKNLDLILHYSADLGHYVADAHVPLHTTKNYNGQLTNQKGIHGFWESRIPELKSDEYNYWLGVAKYIDDPLDKAWNIVKESHAEVDSVLKLEAQLNSSYAADKKYSFENRGTALVKVYSVEYTNDYDKLLNGMVERRMRGAIITIGSLWYTAWVNAGKPDLKSFEDRSISDSMKLVNKISEEQWETEPKEIKGHSD